MSNHLEEQISLQLVSESSNTPTQNELIKWIKETIEITENKGKNITIRVVDEQESQALNSQFRGKQHPTNVLSFPSEVPQEIDPDYLGDIIICAPVVWKEAQTQAISLDAHWVHMLVHGVLHLQGYDHQLESDALIMESRETALMQELGFADPYAN